MLGVHDLGSHWGSLTSLYNNPQIMPYGACYMGGLELLNTPITLTLKLSVTRKIYNLSQIIFYSKKIIIFLLSNVWKLSLYLSIKHTLGYFLWKNNFKIMNGLWSSQYILDRSNSLYQAVNTNNDTLILSKNYYV